MRLLTRVCSLEMTLSNFVDVETADAFFRTGLVTGFPHVTHLDLTCNAENYPSLPAPLVEMLCLFPALQALHVHRMSGPVVDPSASAVVPRGLHSLKLRGSSVRPVLAWLYAVGHLPNVDSVSLPLLQPRDVPTVCAALQQLGGALHHLYITVKCGFRASDNAVDASAVYEFSLHPNLRTLAIRDFLSGSPDDLDPSHMMRLLTRLAGIPALECLSMDINLWLYQNLDWAALDALLSAARFPRLRTVAFTCNSRSDRGEFLRRALPLLEASGLLQIVWRDWDW